MAAFRTGDKQAANELMEIFYPQLRRLAAKYMQGEREGHSWQPTLLVNELYLELIKVKALPSAEADQSNEKAAFFGLAARLMKQLLIHHARPLKARAEKVSLDEYQASGPGGSIAEIDSILRRLEDIRPRLRTIVELKVFEGITLEEIASRVNCSTATITREWNFAKHMLQRWIDFH